MNEWMIFVRVTMKPLYLIKMVGVDRSPVRNDHDQMKSFHCLIFVL